MVDLSRLTTSEATAWREGFAVGIEAARRACQILHDAAPDMATAEAMKDAIRVIDSRKGNCP